MARKRTRNRLEERAPFDEEEERLDEDQDHSDDEDEEEESDETEEEDSDSGEDEDEERPLKKKKAAKAEKAPKSKARARSTKSVRMKVVWGVFNNSNQQVATYPFAQETEARAHADRLMNEKKATYFVQQVKVPFEEK